MAEGPKYPNVEVELVGQEGNAFMVIGATSKALRRAGVPSEEVSAYADEAMSGDYDNVLRTTMAWVAVS